MDRHRLWKFLLIFCLAIFACNLPVVTHTPTAPPFPSPVPPATLPAASSIPTWAYQPVFEAAACASSVPAGYSPECGYLIVPENRARPDSRLIRLHVAVFRNRSGIPVRDAVVHLAGGPGSSSLDVAGYMFGQGLGAVLERHDLVLFDQRGTGFSQPRLDCPEREQLTPLLLNGSMTVEQNQQSIREAFRRCREQLVAQGIDISAYHSVASAADLNDLRLALGYETLNLYAVSYGTRLALTVMRDNPQIVRSAVFDSAYPLQVNLYTALAPNAERAFSVFFDRCAADPSCSAAYPDLRAVFYGLVDELNARPVPVSLAAGGAEQTVRVDGDLLIDVLFVGLYNPAVTASMPRMIDEIRQGEYGILRRRLALYFDTGSALGMQMAVQCAEEIPFSTPEEAYAAAQGVQPQIAAFYPMNVQPLFAICEDWATSLPDPRENQPVFSDV
ncbi:MAG TPA: alpha/beta hydrolase, partial [Anaerolineales bacterium]|nr:alpha/beta hydrolase [Anaerolineales bacterium]